jgi:hypothetical protein
VIQTVLLDLDDTLLDNDMGRFLPPYFEALGRRMARFIAPDKLVNLLLSSTRVMMRNQDPTVTNQQATRDTMWSSPLTLCFRAVPSNIAWNGLACSTFPSNSSPLMRILTFASQVLAITRRS